MTSHLDEGRIQELVDGEIPSSELLPIQAHLAACAECRARLDEARAIAGEADRLIETIELPEPPVRVAPRAPAARPRAWMRHLAWAATLVVAAGLGYVARTPSGGTTIPENKGVAPVAATDLAPSPAETAAAVQPQAVPPTSSRRLAEPLRGAPPGRLAQERDKDGAGASRPVPGVASTEREEAKVASSGRLQSLSPPANSDTLQKKAAQNQPDPKLRLDEVVVTGANEAKAVAPAPPPTAAARRGGVRSRSRNSSGTNLNRVDELVADVASGARPPSAPPAVELTLTAARARLGGILRQIEGLAPLRVDALGDSVRVVYPLGSGELHLVEWLHNGELRYRLRAPAGFPSDSLDRLRARVHE
jgi:anti-sigma factor RsiW